MLGERVMKYLVALLVFAPEDVALKLFLQEGYAYDQ